MVKLILISLIILFGLYWITILTIASFRVFKKYKTSFVKGETLGTKEKIVVVKTNRQGGKKKWTT